MSCIKINKPLMFYILNKVNQWQLEMLCTCIWYNIDVFTLKCNYKVIYNLCTCCFMPISDGDFFTEADILVIRYNTYNFSQGP